MKKDISFKQKQKESWCGYIYTRQNRSQNTDCNKRQRRALDKDKGVSPTRGHNMFEHILTNRRPP